MSTPPPFAPDTASDTADHPSSTSTGTSVRNIAELAGRLLLATLFLLAGVGKLGAYAGTVAYMSSAGVPGALLPLVIATEVLGALATIIGWRTRLVAFLLAAFRFFPLPSFTTTSVIRSR